MKEQDVIVGRLIGGKYRILDYIGGGGFGAVYRAEQLPVGRVVAVKVIHEKVRHEDELRVRFLREARSVARLQSPHIVTLFDYGEEDDGVLYMVFEYVEGRTLKDILIQEKTLPLGLAAQYAIQMLEGLSVAHEQGIVHRDLKPANVIIASGAWGFEQARVLDFGIAKMLENDLNDPTEESTRRGLVLGTPHYMSPEQARTKGIDARADIYAIGALLYTMIVGRPPFTGETTFDILQKHVQVSVEEPLADLDGSDAFKEVLRCALHKDPAQRYQNAREMAEALVPFAAPPERAPKRSSDTKPETDALSNLTPGAAFKSRSRETRLQQSAMTPARKRLWFTVVAFAAGLLAMVIIHDRWFAKSGDSRTAVSGTPKRTRPVPIRPPPSTPPVQQLSAHLSAPTTPPAVANLPAVEDASAAGKADLDSGVGDQEDAEKEVLDAQQVEPTAPDAKPRPSRLRSKTRVRRVRSTRGRRTTKADSQTTQITPRPKKMEQKGPSKGSLRLEEF